MARIRLGMTRFLFSHVVLLCIKPISLQNLGIERYETLTGSENSDCRKYQDVKERYERFEKKLNELKLKCREGYYGMYNSSKQSY